MRSISAALLLAAFLQTTPATAQIEADSLSVAGPAGQPDSSIAPAPGTRLAPRSALWRSALIPGWGQAALGHPFKAALFFGAGAAWMSAATSEGVRVSDATSALERQDRAARRNTRVLYYVITATLAGIDAYVDAHLEDFDIDAAPYDGPGSIDAGARLMIRF